MDRRFCFVFVFFVAVSITGVSHANTIHSKTPHVPFLNDRHAPVICSPKLNVNSSAGYLSTTLSQSHEEEFYCTRKQRSTPIFYLSENYLILPHFCFLSPSVNNFKYGFIVHPLCNLSSGAQVDQYMASETPVGQHASRPLPLPLSRSSSQPEASDPPTSLQPVERPSVCSAAASLCLGTWFVLLTSHFNFFTSRVFAGMMLGARQGYGVAPSSCAPPGEMGAELKTGGGGKGPY